MEILGYILACIMGLTLGLIGAGGSILAVPILVYFMGVEPVTATGYSLLIVGFTALVGAIRYLIKGQINLKTTFFFAVPSIVAVYVTRAWLLPSIPDPLFSFETYVMKKDDFVMMLFSILMLLSALFMIRNGKTLTQHSEGAVPKPIRPLMIGLDGMVVGVFTGIVGAGGGFLIIPALVIFAGLDMKIAVGSSLMIIAVKSLIGFIGDIQSGINIDVFLILTFVLCTSTGMIAGTILSKTVPTKRLKQAFGWFTLCVGIMIIFKELF